MALTFSRRRGYNIGVKTGNLILALTLAFSFLNSAAAAEFTGLSLGEIRESRTDIPQAFPAALRFSPVNEKNKLPAALANNPLIVVHASRVFDEDAVAAPGIDEVVAKFKAEKRPVIYLINDQSGEGYGDWYSGDHSPDYELFSIGGEHNLPLLADEVTIVGGFFGSYDGARGCQTLAVRDAIRMHFESSGRPFTVHMPLKAIFFWDEYTDKRDELLALDPETASPAKLRKVFDRFAEIFFLVDTFPVSTEEALGFGHPFLDEEGNPAYRMGEPVDTARYTFRIFFGSRQVSEFGTGPRQVSLKLSR